MVQKPKGTSGNQEEPFDLDSQVGFLLRKAHQKNIAHFDQVLKSFNITPPQFSTLVRLYSVEETSQNHLGRLVAMDQATTFGVVNRLKGQGLIKQRADETDARRSLLSLTEKGIDQVKEMLDVAENVSKLTLQSLTHTEAEQLISLLRKIS